MRTQKAIDNWFGMLKEATTKDPAYIQRLYEIEVDVRISKNKGGNKDQTVDDIRAVQSITTVTDPAKKGAVTHARATDQYWFNRYIIKFELNSDLPPKYYVRSRLIPSIAKIKGLNLVRYGYPVEVTGR